MKIGILTDSTCDLPTETIAHYGIEVVPLHIQMGDEVLFDGVNITKDEFYARLPDYDPAPTTAAPGPNTFLERYTRLADEDCEAILAIHISETLSATIKSARLAAEAFSRIPVTVLDSGQLSMGLGFMVQEAASRAQAGESLDAILAALEHMMPRTYVFAALDTLEYLRRSGRMNSAVARFGELFHLKALLHMHAGKATAHRVRTAGRAMARMLAWLEEYSPIERLAILHAGVETRALELREQVHRYLPGGDIPVTQITPVLGSHLGVGALGFAILSTTPYGVV